MQKGLMHKLPWIALIVLSCGIFYTFFQYNGQKNLHQIAQVSTEEEIQEEAKQETSRVTQSADESQDLEQTLQSLLEYARAHLPEEGTLARKQGGYIYLKLDDAYVNDLFDRFQLERFGFRKVPYFRSSSAPGAHISVFYTSEHVDPKELGKKFTFTIKGVKVVSAKHFKRYLVLQVESPELERLRESYDKSPLLQNHLFHISIATKQFRPSHKHIEGREGSRSSENKRPENWKENRRPGNWRENRRGASSIQQEPSTTKSDAQQDLEIFLETPVPEDSGK